MGKAKGLSDAISMIKLFNWDKHEHDHSYTKILFTKIMHQPMLSLNHRNIRRANIKCLMGSMNDIPF